MPFLSINSAEIYYELHGQGHPLILISGFGCDHSFWLPLIEPLSKKFQVLLFDNRGSGQTKGDNKNFIIETLALDALTLSKALKLEKPHILGHSMGGCIALQIGIQAPLNISKLMVLNSFAKFSSISCMNLNCLIKLQALNVDFDILMDGFMPWGFSREFLDNAKNVAAHKTAVKNYPYVQTLEGNTRQVKALENFDVRDKVSTIKSQTLIIGNERDLLVAPDEIEFLGKKILGSTVQILPGAHLAVIENSALYIQIISDFLI